MAAGGGSVFGCSRIPWGPWRNGGQGSMQDDEENKNLLGSQVVVGGFTLAELGGAEGANGLLPTCAPPPFCCALPLLFCKITKVELMAPSIMRKGSVIVGRGGSAMGEEGCG